jgi:hypothetical protein
MKKAGYDKKGFTMADISRLMGMILSQKLNQRQLESDMGNRDIQLYHSPSTGGRISPGVYNSLGEADQSTYIPFYSSYGSAQGTQPGVLQGYSSGSGSGGKYSANPADVLGSFNQNDQGVWNAQPGTGMVPPWMAQLMIDSGKTSQFMQEFNAAGGKADPGGAAQRAYQNTFNAEDMRVAYPEFFDQWKRHPDSEISNVDEYGNKKVWQDERSFRGDDWKSDREMNKEAVKRARKGDTSKPPMELLKMLEGLPGYEQWYDRETVGQLEGVQAKLLNQAKGK